MHYLNCLDKITSFDEAKNILKSKNLLIKEFKETDLYIIRYNKQHCDINDPDVKKCRGLILSKVDNSVVCPVPNKFTYFQITCNNTSRILVHAV